MIVEVDPNLNSLGVARYEIRAPIPTGGSAPGILYIGEHPFEYVLRGGANSKRILVPENTIPPGTYIVTVGDGPDTASVIAH